MRGIIAPARRYFRIGLQWQPVGSVQSAVTPLRKPGVSKLFRGFWAALPQMTGRRKPALGDGGDRSRGRTHDHHAATEWCPRLTINNSRYLTACPPACKLARRAEWICQFRAY